MLLPETTFALGTVIQDRYVVEDVLGVGGTSNVYLVHDLQRAGTPEQEMRFALKELRDKHKNERVRFAFEGTVLKRLQHPALPHVYDLYEESGEQPGILILEHIAGVNLEILRQQQPEQRFPLAEVIVLMRPIVEAMTYLHHQQPPIVHRDIKPANIIVAEGGRQTFLIDFGIAKEYEADATTTAVRHCTPGYGAPEQYGSIGTDTRADIYSLGATCYCLLTGTIPVDALLRTTAIATRRTDPLKPAQQHVLDIPTHISRAIERAMSIGYEQRFASVEDFWSVLQASSATPSEHLPYAAFRNTESLALPQTVRRKHAGYRIFAFTAILLLLLCAFLAAFVLPTNPLSMHSTTAASNASVASHALSIGRSKTATATSMLYPTIAKTYRGTLRNLLAQTTSDITLTAIKQNQQSLSGRFTGLQMIANFTGVLDSSRHILFTIPRSSKHPPIFFDGNIRPDGTLVGNYCNQDQDGQCVANYGLWSLNPEK